VVIGLLGIIGAVTPAAEALPSPRRNPIQSRELMSCCCGCGQLQFLGICRFLLRGIVFDSFDRVF
jgi:hypothetical protein